MHLENLSLVNFRNYERAEVEFSKNANLIYGLNAQGKTNLLEAIYLLCLGRSFRSSKNKELLKTDAPFFTIDG
ncbi:AAA family ATPase, partial [candidate division KSB1 bacterium]|nr:AAA family ATPase [candidate division KSB1 bacterium]NIR72475.1 AAA family ATPase [candidate division KSB1 bacterium]NIS24060.1 AAA family ATPase [candidate division KSB1 bacterium]NIT70979.1 AAA family ATPase [candidate division KSB1 bacterium]NIU27390.1 AAA family ATPase [candidate division KSB1 bacterium]